MLSMRSGINHMWILRNSKDLLDNLKSRSFSQVSPIKIFDFSTDALPEGMLKGVMKELWLTRISSLSNKVCLNVVLLEVLLFMPNSLIRHSKYYLYWIPKLHKTPCKERYIAGSSTCSTKELSIHLTNTILLEALSAGTITYLS
jgi:hypothetical protein